MSIYDYEPNKTRLDENGNLIQTRFERHEPDLTDYAQTDIEKAETAFIAYLELEKKHNKYLTS